MAVLLLAFLTGIFSQVLIDRQLKNKLTAGQTLVIWNKCRGGFHRIVVPYLLVHIGLVGGAAIAQKSPTDLVVPGALSVSLAAALFAIALLALIGLGVHDRDTRISLATHFGSVSVGTFAAAQAFLKQEGITFDPSAAAWLVLMEIPAVLIGATVFRRDWKALIQTLQDPEIVILLASLLFGCLGGPKLLEGVAVLVVQPFNVVLGCFLFEMGQRTAGSLPHIRRLGAKLIAFGVLMPLLGGSLAALAGTAAGMPIGDVILLSTLSASASYVAATAAMSRLVKPKAIATSLTVALGVTLPFNMLVGIRLYAGMARQMQGLSMTQFRDTAVSEMFAHLPVAMVPAVALTLAIGLGLMGLLLLVAQVADVARKMVPTLSATLKARLIQVVELIGRNSQVMMGWLGQPQRRTSFVLPAARCLRVAGGSELASQGALSWRSRWLGERSGSPARSAHLHSAGNDPPRRYSLGYC